MLIWLTILLLPPLTVLTGPNEKDSTNRLDIRSSLNCCKFPVIDYKTYEKKCGSVGIKGIQVIPCSFECIFKAAGVLNGTQLLLDKVNPMMNELLKDQKQLKDLFVQGFVQCKAKELEMLKTLKRHQFPDTGKCSSLPMLYSICAYRHVFNNCPEENWTNSSLCNRIRAREMSKFN